MTSIFAFICKHCGPRDTPCEHALDLIELRMLREMKERNRVQFALIESQLLEIIHNQNRPLSATLKLFSDSPGGTMPATILVGGTANSLFQEWSGPGGTGTVVPNAGAPAFASDNTAVATVDPTSGVATGVSAGVANITGTDAANGLTASDVLTVNAVATPAVSATLTLSPN